MAYSKVGNYGRIQWILTFVTSVFRNSGNYIYYTFAYLVLEQQFVCTTSGSDSFKVCSTEEICAERNLADSKLLYKVDVNYYYYFNNWFLEMDLLCRSPASIGIMITAYYAGFVLGGIFYRAPELLGRKKSVMISMGFSLVFQTWMMFTNSFMMRTLCFLGMGFC